MDPLPKSIVDETHQWAHILARKSPESFRAHLKTSPPIDPTLHSILNLMVSSGQLWNNESSNEDTYLKARLGPFLDTYLLERCCLHHKLLDGDTGGLSIVRLGSARARLLDCDSGQQERFVSGSVGRKVSHDTDRT